MNTPEGLKPYLLNGIAGAPAVFSKLAESISDWDARPDPDRFTLREAIAHLADWDEIFLMRLNRALTEDNPHLPSVDEGVLATERQYEKQDPTANLNRFRENRKTLSDAFHALTPDQWERTAHREFVGDVTVGQMAAIILGHDAYHLRQFAEQA